jgi:predicted transcriptional regulator
MTGARYYIERRQDGQYAAIHYGAQQPNGLFATQAEAIAWVDSVGGLAEIARERDADTDRGGRDRWEMS